MICIDALDEVDRESRSKLIEAIKYVMENVKCVVKVFATTRMDVDVAHQLHSFLTLEIEADDNSEDIKQFIEVRVRKTIDDGLLSVSHSLVPEIHNFLFKRAQGM